MRPGIVVAGVVALVLVSAFATPVTGSEDVEEYEGPTLHVALEADGDATVSLVSVYDLSEPDERDAFDSLREDESVRSGLLERFADRLDAVAADVGGETSVLEESVDVRTDDDYGIVVLSVTWNGLAAVDDDTLVVREPFASGFEPDRTLVFTTPDGSTIESTGTEPATIDETRAAWETGTDLSGFELTISLADDADDAIEATSASDEGADGTPGFGAGAGAIGIGVAIGAAILHWRHE